MDKSTTKPLYQTTTEEGTTIKIEGNIPTLPTLKEQLEKNFPPSNPEIEKQLDSAKQTLEETKKEADLNERGQTIVQDVEKLIDVTSTALKEKNKAEKLQQLFTDTKGATERIVPVLQKEGKKVQQKGSKLAKGTESELTSEAKELQTNVQQLYGAVRDLLWNFLRSEDFRELAADWVSFLQFLGTKNLKEKAIEQEQKGGAVGNVAAAVEEGLEQPPKPVDEDELQQRTEDMFQDLINRVRRKPEYQSAFRDILQIYDQLQTRLDRLATEVKKETEEVSQEVDTDALWKILLDVEEIICQFTGKREWEQFKTTFKSNYYSVKEDPELRGWLEEMRSFLNDIVENPEGITDQEYKNRAKDLTRRGREILQKEKWSDKFDELSDQFNVLLENIRKDSTTNEFAERLKTLAKDLAFNEKGLPDINVMQDSLTQIKNILVPLFKQQLENISIGRVDFTNDTYDVRIEDLGFSGSFLPEHIDFAMRNDTHFDTKDTSKDLVKTVLAFQVDNIKPEFKNFKFYYRRKTFPKIEDFGVADMKITGKGGLIRVNWKIESKEGAKPVAKLTGVTVYIDKLELHIVGEKTKHELLDRMLAPLVSKNIKNKISASLEDYLRTKLTEATTRLNSILQSSPVENLKEKANEVMQEGYKQIQEKQKAAI